MCIRDRLYAGAKLLMDEMGVETVDRVTLAGAFGAHISPKHAMVLGMIPDVPLNKVISAGNAAGTGARIALCNVEARNTVEAMVHQIHKVETAIEPRFQEHFVNASAIPNAVDTFPELSKMCIRDSLCGNFQQHRGDWIIGHWVNLAIARVRSSTTDIIRAACVRLRHQSQRC